MKIDEILLKETKPYIGYQLVEIGVTLWDEKDMTEIWKAWLLEKVPSKISKFCDRKKISKAWRGSQFHYFILSTDGTMFELFY